MDESGMEHLEDIDMFIHDNTFDMKLLIEDDEDLYRTNTEINQIASTIKSVAKSKVVGLFVNTEGIQFVESAAANTIFVYSDSQIKKEKDHANAISSLMDVIIIRPLIGKVALFHRLQGKAHSQRNSEDFFAAAIVKEFPYLYSNLSPTSITAIETNSSDELFQCIQQNKRNIERLIGEMIALSKRCGLPEEIMPAFEEFQTAVVSKEVARDLFKLDKAIEWCGFRYRTFHIYVKHTSNESEEKVLEEKISTFLATQGIMNFELIYITGDFEEYSYIGSMISPKIQKAKEAPSKAECQAQREAQGEKRDHHATLGCFASRNCSSVCALISKHVAVHFGNEIFDKDKRLLGKVIPETGCKGHYDIAAAEIIGERVLKLDTSFRNYDGEIRRASLVELSENLQDQTVYLRGAKTKLGVGTIEIPIFLKKDGKYHTKVRPGSFLLKKPDGRLAEKGDSGAILCLDDLNQNIYVCSMLIGKCGEEESYCFLPLSHGLEELSKITNDEFKLITHMENSPAQIHAVGDYLQASGSCKYLT